MTPIRLTLEPAPCTIAATDPGGNGTGGDTSAKRVVAGLAVPYEIEAQVGWRLVTFAAGSVTVAPRSPLLLGHDPNQPVGVLLEAIDTPSGVRTSHQVDATRDGDTALVQAASGSRAGLSVGVDVDRYEASDDDPDRIRVLAARVVETSLVALAAYPTAGVDHVAAHQPPTPGGPMPPDPATPPTPTDPPPVSAVDMEAIAQRVADRIEADQRRALIVAEPLPARMRLGEYCATWARAQRGDGAARERLEAALTRETIADNQGVIPVAYVDQIIDSIGAARPLHDALTSAEMPPAGMEIRRPQVTQRVDSAANTESRWLADDTAGMPSGALNIGTLATPVEQWAWGGSASVALVERSMPSYVEEAFTQMVNAYYRDVEAKIAAKFPKAASTVTTVGGAVAAFMVAYRDWPRLIVAGGDAYGKILDATGHARFATGTADASGDATIYGMRLVASPDVTPADVWVTSPDYLETRESSPLRLTVADVGGLSIEIGVTSFFAMTQTRQDGGGGVDGAVRIAGYTPPVDGQATATSGKRDTR